MEKYLWLDMEMTGLDPLEERIIEVAAIVTDKNFKPIDTYESVVFQDAKFIDNMDAWNTEHHNKSGLTAKVPEAPKQSQVESELVTLVKKHFREPAILCGNSIGQDRKFIDLYMPELAKLLHYRMLDVSAWKIIMEEQFQRKFDKKDSHRALEDIEESIAEMLYYLQFVNPPNK